MSCMRHDKQLAVRVPAKLADALEHRAEELGVPAAAVVRDAVAREMTRPVDPCDRAFIARWLEGSVPTASADGEEE